MSTKWEDWLLNRGEMPTIDVPEVPMPDVVYRYICLNCGKRNNWFESICQACEEHDEGYEV